MSPNQPRIITLKVVDVNYSLVSFIVQVWVCWVLGDSFTTRILGADTLTIEILTSP